MKKLLLTLVLASASFMSLAAETFYISDKQYVPLRSGPNSSFRITHRGLPSGTQMTVHETDKDSGYARITTAKGTQGWIRSQYLMKEKPAALQLAEFKKLEEELSKKNNQLNLQLRALNKDNSELGKKLTETTSQLKSTSAELSEITSISENALTLDTNNARLINDNEMLKHQLELLEADNERMQNSEENEAFLNGALAVLLGVIVALIVPRLWPKKRRHSEWA